MMIENVGLEKASINVKIPRKDRLSGQKKDAELGEG